MTVQDRDPDGNRSEEIGTSREGPTEAAAGELLTGAFENPVPDWDRYTIVDYLGEGAMGLVYRAVDPASAARSQSSSSPRTIPIRKTGFNGRLVPTLRSSTTTCVGSTRSATWGAGPT